MIKHFCDECGVEVFNPAYSLDMIGKCLCSKHASEYIEKHNKTTYSITWDKNMNTPKVINE